MALKLNTQQASSLSTMLNNAGYEEKQVQSLLSGNKVELFLAMVTQNEKNRVNSDLIGMDSDSIRECLVGTFNFIDQKIRPLLESNGIPINGNVIYGDVYELRMKVPDRDALSVVIESNARMSLADSLLLSMEAVRNGALNEPNSLLVSYPYEGFEVSVYNSPKDGGEDYGKFGIKINPLDEVKEVEKSNGTKILKKR